MSTRHYFRPSAFGLRSVLYVVSPPSALGRRRPISLVVHIWPLASSRFYLGLLPPLIHHHTPTRHSPNSHSVSSLALLILVAFMPSIWQHVFEELSLDITQPPLRHHFMPKGTVSRVSLLRHSNLSLPALNYLFHL
jgi:hypothetical protein